MENARFTLTPTNPAGTAISRSTDAKGFAAFTDLAPGVYRLEEELVPLPWIKSELSWTVTVADDGTVSFAETPPATDPTWAFDGDWSFVLLNERGPDPVPLTVRKKVIGSGTGPFPFTLKVEYKNQPYRIADQDPAATGPRFTVNSDSSVSFALEAGQEIVIPGLPEGGKISLVEGGDASYVVLMRKFGTGLENTWEILAEGSSLAPLTMDQELGILVVNNNSGYGLPRTGGAGTLPHTLGGIALMLGAAALCYGHWRRRRERRFDG